MGDDEKRSLADRMKSNDDESSKSLSDAKRDTQQNASIQDRLNMSGEESDPSAVTRPSREGITDQLKDALERAKEEAAAAQDDGEPKTLAEKMREAREGSEDDDEPQSLADKMRDQDED